MSRPMLGGRHPDPESGRFRWTIGDHIWMVTFTDLVALMLTFFVMLFSMSQLQQQKWQSLVESLASNLNSMSRVESAKLAADFHVEAEILPPGTDLEYLETILLEHFATDAMLTGGRIERVAEGLSIAFPKEQLFRADTAELTERGERVVAATGGILRHLHNAVDVDARIASAATPTAVHWQIALARSVAIARLLTQGGFAGPIEAHGVGMTWRDGSGESVVGGEGIRLLVRESRRGRP